MPLNLRLAALVAVVAIAGAGAFAFFGGAPPAPTVPTASPPAASQSATPESAGPTRGAMDISGWAAYTSERYGFEIKRPADWTEHPAQGDWTIDDAGDFASPSAEGFSAADRSVLVNVVSAPVEPGTSLDSWLVDYCERLGCTGTDISANAETITIGGQPGILFVGESETQAFLLVGDRVYVLSCWRGDNDVEVSPYGGSRRLVEAFASAFTLRPAGAMAGKSAPTLTKSFTSTMHGYSLEFPEAWDAIAATPTDDSDYFRAGAGTGALRIGSQPIPDGESPDPWIDEVFLPVGGECGPPRSTLGVIDVDGREGRVRASCGEIEASVVVGDRVYLFTLFVGDGVGEGGSAWAAGGRALFDAIIATVQLPEDPGATASPAAS